MTEVDSAGVPGTTATLGSHTLATLGSHTLEVPRVALDTEDPVVSIDPDLDPAAPSPGPGLWRRWFRAVTLGECLGFLVPATVGALTAHAVDAVSVPLLVLAGAAEGAALGWFQARVPRRALPRLPVAALIPLTVAGGLVLLFSIGVAQWAVLRAHVHGAGRWIWGTALARTVALVAFMAVTMPLWQPGQSTVVIALIGVLGGLVMASTVAALTGWLAVSVTRPGDRK